MTIDQKYLRVIEDLGWHISYDPDDVSIEIGRTSPAGEDFSFEVYAKDFPQGVIEAVDDFDPDEHAEMWVSHRGERGCPSSIHELIEDAEAIKEMLRELADAMNDVKNGTYTPFKLGEDLCEDSNLLDPITFKDVILAVHCNCRVISRETVTKQFFEILEQRLLDMNELLNRNIDKIAEEARKGRA